MYTDVLTLGGLVDEKQADGCMPPVLCGIYADWALFPLRRDKIALELGKQLHRAQHRRLLESLVDEERIGGVNALCREEGDVLDLVAHKLSERIRPPYRGQVLRWHVLFD